MSTNKLELGILWTRSEFLPSTHSIPRGLSSLMCCPIRLGYLVHVYGYGADEALRTLRSKGEIVDAVRSLEESYQQQQR